MAVIELGLVSSAGAAPPAGPGRRPPRRPEPRRLLAAAVAAGCLLTVTGSTRPEPHELTQLWTAPFSQQTDTYRLTGDSIYVLNHTGGLRLTAHDARTGAARWSTTAVEETSWLNAVESGVMLMPTGAVTVDHQEPDGTESPREFNRDTTAVDTITGRQLWRQRGEVTAALGDRVLLSEWNETGERARRLRVVRIRDGATVWSRARGDLDFWTTDTTAGARAERLVTIDPQGVVEVLALADGAVLATGRLPWTGYSRNDDYSTLTVQGRRIHLDQTVRNRSSVSVYDTDTLRLLWRIEPASPGGSYPCGPVVCISDADGTAGHDRETGELRWRLPGAANGAPLLAGALLIEENGEARRRLVDGTTGRLLADLGTATPVWDALGRGTPYLVARTVEPPGRTSVSRFDPAAGEVLLRGTIMPVLDYGCQQEGGLLACVTPDNRLVVTDVG